MTFRLFGSVSCGEFRCVLVRSCNKTLPGPLTSLISLYWLTDMIDFEVRTCIEAKPW